MENGTILKLSEHLPHLETLHLDHLVFSSYDWLAHSPQSLTKLRMDRWNGTVELPSSLIHFRAGFVKLSASSFVSSLPSSLQSWVTDAMVGVKLVVPLLPSTTHTFLGTTPENSVEISLEEYRDLLEQLPKSLKRFQFLRSLYINFEEHPELISLLPATLTELHVDEPSLPCLVCGGQSSS